MSVEDCCDKILSTVGLVFIVLFPRLSSYLHIQTCRDDLFVSWLESRPFSGDVFWGTISVLSKPDLELLHILFVDHSPWKLVSNLWPLGLQIPRG